ncbi:hypothetical protein AX16_002822 [Volvariella volvacea WC 439]|nr:hypothetical protein AX16_002822 [Volvariella volvacea WC 439]
MPSLPETVYQHIAQYVSERSDLCALSLVCQAFRYEAQQLIFRVIPQLRTESRYCLVIPILASSPWHARQVREFYFTPHSTVIPQDIWDMLFTALISMVNLERFAFSCGRIAQSNLRDILRALPQCTFRLRAFFWSNYCTDSSLVPFLESQPEIRTLSLHWCTSPNIAPGMLPNLTHLNCCSHVAEALVPKRAISWVYCTDQLSSIERLAPAFLESLRQLEYFIYMVYLDTCLHDLIPYLSNLRRLKIFAHSATDDFLTDLAQLPCLEELYIMLLAGFSNYPEVSQEIFQTCTTLAYLEIMSNDTNTAWIWRRGSDEPEVRSYGEPSVGQEHFGLMKYFRECDHH